MKVIEDILPQVCNAAVIGRHLISLFSQVRGKNILFIFSILSLSVSQGCQTKDKTGKQTKKNK